MKSKSKIFMNRDLNLAHKKISAFVDVIGKERLISISYHYSLTVVWYWDDQSSEIKEAEEKSDDASLLLEQQKANGNLFTRFLLIIAVITMFIIALMIVN